MIRIYNIWLHTKTSVKSIGLEQSQQVREELRERRTGLPCDERQRADQVAMRHTFNFMSFEPRFPWIFVLLFGLVGQRQRPFSGQFREGLCVCQRLLVPISRTQGRVAQSRPAQLTARGRRRRGHGGAEGSKSSYEELAKNHDAR